MDSQITKVRLELLDDAVTSPRDALPDDFVEPPTTLWNETPAPDDWLDATVPRTSSPERARGSSAPPPMTPERLASLARTDPAESRRARRESPPRLALARTKPMHQSGSRPLPPLERTVLRRSVTPAPRAEGSRPPTFDDEGFAAARVEPTELASAPGIVERPSSGRASSGGDRRSRHSVGDSTSPLRIGFELGNYIIRRQIAKGGMGVVYEAEHRYLRRRVAIKVLRESRLKKPEVVRRFFREAVAAAQIGHGGVVEVIDYGHTPSGGAYLVMELLHGESLADRLDDRHQLSFYEAIDIARSIADIAAAAHSAGIVHRDLKPDNIFLSRGDSEHECERVKVLDFGVAKFLQATDNNQKTKLGKLLGTPYYMSPEQCEGRREVDHRSDIYSLGCLLYEMLTGRCPFAGHTVDVLIAHRRMPPLPVRELNPDVPPEIDALVMQMLAKRPEQRPQSMAQVVAELTLVERSHSGSIDGPVSASPRSHTYDDLPAPGEMVRMRYEPPMRRRKKRSFWGKLLLFTAALALIAAAGATAYLTYFNGELPSWLPLPLSL